MGDVYFDGDPAVDSSRRHMERVLKGEPRRRWPWLVAAVGGGGLWALWRMAGQRPNDKERSEAQLPAHSPKS
jgi:hypothetical protein